MGLFGNKKSQKQKLQKHHEESMKSLANALQNKKVGTFRCWNCGKTQRVTYYGSGGSWRCPNCKEQNRIG